MDVQKILLHAYKTYRSLSSRRPTHCDGLHLAMYPAHRALRGRHSQRHVLGKRLFPAMSFTVAPLHAEIMLHAGMMQPAPMNILLCLSTQSPENQRRFTSCCAMCFLHRCRPAAEMDILLACLLSPGIRMFLRCDVLTTNSE